MRSPSASKKKFIFLIKYMEHPVPAILESWGFINPDVWNPLTTKLLAIAEERSSDVAESKHSNDPNLLPRGRLVNQSWTGLLFF